MAQSSLTKYFPARKRTLSRPEKRRKCDTLNADECESPSVAKVVGLVEFSGKLTTSPANAWPGQVATLGQSASPRRQAGSSEAASPALKAGLRTSSRKGNKAVPSGQPRILETFSKAQELEPTSAQPTQPLLDELLEPCSETCAGQAALSVSVTHLPDRGSRAASAVTAVTEPASQPDRPPPQGAASSQQSKLSSCSASPAVQRRQTSTGSSASEDVVRADVLASTISQVGTSSDHGSDSVASNVRLSIGRSGRRDVNVGDSSQKLADPMPSPVLVPIQTGQRAFAKEEQIHGKTSYSHGTLVTAPLSTPVSHGNRHVDSNPKLQLKTRDCMLQTASTTSIGAEACLEEPWKQQQVCSQSVFAYASSADGRLALPSKYRDLERIFGFCERLVAQMQGRQELCTFEKLKKGVEQMSSRTFSRETLGQIVTVFPSAYNVRFEKLPAAYGRHASDMTIEPNLDAACSRDTAASSSGASEADRSRSRKQLITLIASRKQQFTANLIDIVKQHHEVFLSKLPQPFVLPEGRQINRWHGSFALEHVPDIPVAQLPWPKQQEAHPSAMQVLGPQPDSHEKVQLALAKYERIVNAALFEKQRQKQQGLQGSAHTSIGHCSLKDASTPCGAAVENASVTSTQALIDKAHSILAAAAAAKPEAAMLRAHPNAAAGAVAAVVAAAQPGATAVAAAGQSGLPHADPTRGVAAWLLEKGQSILSVAAAAKPEAAQLQAQLQAQLSAMDQRAGSAVTAIAAAGRSAAATAASAGLPRTDPLKGVPASLLEKVRQKEKLNAILAMVSGPEDDEEIALLERLPSVASTIRTAFVIEKKSSLPWDAVVPKVQSVDRLGMSRATAEKLIRGLLRIAPFWISEAKTSKGVYVRIDVDAELSPVRLAISKALEELKRSVACL